MIDLRDMTLIEIVDQIYNNSHEVSFGLTDNWNHETFTSGWFSNMEQQQPNAPGLYWFLTDANIINIERPESLPRNGCDFGLTARNNLQTFTPSLLAVTNSSELTVVYNGHENNVRNRVRQHFNLTNHDTGALGIRHYSHSHKVWILRYFTTLDIPNLNVDNREVISNLLNSKTGRTAIENAWRIKNGWPILCKE